MIVDYNKTKDKGENVTHPEEQILKYIIKNKVNKISLNTLRVLFGGNDSLFDVSIVRLDHELNVIKTELNLIGEWDVIVIMPFRKIKKLLNPIKIKGEK